MIHYISLFWRRVLFYLTLLFFTALFLMPTQFLPEESIFNWWDKAQHTAVFITLAFFGMMAHPQRRRNIILGLLSYGALIEIAQSLTGWRQGELGDWYADAYGIAIVWLMSCWFGRTTAK